MIRLTIPSIDEDDIQAVSKVLNSGYLVQGQIVNDFERTVSDYVGSKFAIAVSNCTAALHLSLLSMDIRAGDLVIVTSYSWPASANVIELCGAQPVFIDILPDTFNINPQCLDATLHSLTSNHGTRERVKAILPVHTFGQMADMPLISEISDYYDVPVIEDAACALGADIDHKHAGTWGKMGCFSFHPRKAITTGEGGIIVTDDPDLADKVRMLRNHGQDPHAPTPDFKIPGFNYRMTEFQAALGLAQMAKLKRIISARRHLAAEYNNLLKDTHFQIPQPSTSNQHVYQSYVVLLPIQKSNRRTEIISDLKARGIETTIGTWHIPMTTYYRNHYGFKEGDFPITDDVFVRSLTLPLYEGLEHNKQHEIIQQLNNVLLT